MYMIGKHFIKELLLWPRKYILIAVEFRGKEKKCLIDSLFFQKKPRIWGESACLPRCKILEKNQFDFCCWFFTCIICTHVSEDNFCKLVLPFYHMVPRMKDKSSSMAVYTFPFRPILPASRESFRSRSRVSRFVFIILFLMLE